MIVIMNMFNEEIDISRNMIILNVIFILNRFADMSNHILKSFIKK